MQCVRLCPVHALNGKDYPTGLTDKNTCVVRSESLAKVSASPCGRCIMVCPVGEDRQLFGREDMEMYSGKNPAYDRYNRAWNHVRSYGTLRPGKKQDTD